MTKATRFLYSIIDCFLLGNDTFPKPFKPKKWLVNKISSKKNQWNSKESLGNYYFARVKIYVDIQCTSYVLSVYAFTHIGRKMFDSHGKVTFFSNVKLCKPMFLFTSTYIIVATWKKALSHTLLLQGCL